MEDPTKVINHLVRSLGVTAHQATAFIEVVQEIVEEHVTDDVSVLAPPLIVGRFGDPVLDRLAMRLEDPRWTLPESIDISPAELAAQLRLPVDVVEAYPIVGRFGILAKCLDRLSVSDEDAELHLRMLDTWLGTYAEEGGRDFEVLPTGSRGAFRGWLLDRFDMLSRYGYGARIATEYDDGLDGLAHSFDDGRRPDLIARITDDGDAVRRGDWLVIQHKTTAVGHNAHDELAVLVDWLRAELGDRLERRRGARPPDRRRRQPAPRAGAARACVRLPVARRHRLPPLGPQPHPRVRGGRPRRHRHRLPGHPATGIARARRGLVRLTPPRCTTAEAPRH